MRPKSTQACRVVPGALLDGMAWRVAAASVQELAFRRSYVYPNNGSAPQRVIALVGFDYEVFFSGATEPTHIPWMLQDGFDAIDIAGVVTLPQSAFGKVAIRASTETMITSVTTSPSPYFVLGESSEGSPTPPGVWSTAVLFANRPMDHMAPFSVRVVPDRPADDLVAITFQVRADPESADPGGDVEYPVKIMSLYVCNAITDVED